MAVGGTGTNNSSSTPAVTTTNARDLLVAGNNVATWTTAAGTGFTKRFITSPNGDIAEDRVVTAAGSYTATATLGSAGAWVMQMAAFRAAVLDPETQPPTAPAGLVASAVSMSQINLAWTASTDNIGVTGYLIERCQGAGCSNFAQVGTATGTSFNNTGLAIATSYSYRVRATDAAGNLGAYSNIADGTTLADTQPPTAPSNLTATAVGDADQPRLDRVHGQRRRHGLFDRAVPGHRLLRLRVDRGGQRDDVREQRTRGERPLQLPRAGHRRRRQPRRLLEHGQRHHAGSRHGEPVDPGRLHGGRRRRAREWQLCP